MLRVNSNLVVITGGPGTGKTTVLQELERRGFACVAEVARQIILEQVHARGDALPWANTERYCELMLKRSVDSFLKHDPAYAITFCDRGIPDTLCYARLIRSPRESEILEACRVNRYASRVFLTPPWREIYQTDAERKQTYEDAVRTYEQMKLAYQDCGYELVEIPRLDTPSRADFILDYLPG
jgi:predicted ATPase